MGSAAKTMNCDGIARWYEPAEHLCFGRALERRRFAFLDELRDARRALVCGGGDGRFLAELLRSNPRVEATYVDASGEMTRLAERRVRRLGEEFSARAEFHCGDLRSFVPARGGYDLIATHFFFDCFTEEQARELARRLQGWASPGARWVLSEFDQASPFFARLWTTAIIRGLYAGFRLTTGLRVRRIPSCAEALRRAGFALQAREAAAGGLLVSELWGLEPGDSAGAEQYAEKPN